MPQYQTIGDLARKTGVHHQTIRQIVDRLFPSLPRIGMYRVLDDAQSEALLAELRRRGLLRRHDPRPQAAAG